MKKIGISILLLLSLSLPLFAFDGFTDIFDQPLEEVSLSPPEKSGFATTGSVSFSLESFIDRNNVENSAIEFGGGLDLDLSWRGSIVDAKVNLSLHPSFDKVLQWTDLFTGLSLTTFFDGGRVEVGLLKKEWGSGDGVHVVDIVNAPDYRSGIVDDPLEMKVSEPMLYATFNWKNNSFDLFYKPNLTLMASEAEGRWAMMSQEDLLGMFGPLSITIVGGNSPSSEEYSMLSKYQFGGRYKQSLGPFDLGVIYYNGYYYQPSYYVHDITLGAPITLELDTGFTHAQLFGFEGTFVTGPLTFMAEGGLWLSEDAKNEQPDKFNNRWVYLAGVGILIPGTNIYASATYNGHYIVGFEEFAFTPGVTDDIPVETLQALLSSDGKGYLNTLTAALEIPMAREKALLRVAGTYQVETKGFSLLPSFKWSISDDLTLKTSGRIFGSFHTGASSIFDSWKDNSSVKIELAHIF